MLHWQLYIVAVFYPAAVILALFLGSALIILLGTIFLNTFYIRNFSEAFQLGATLFSIWMIAKIILASSIYFGVKKVVCLLIDFRPWV